MANQYPRIRPHTSVLDPRGNPHDPETLPNPASFLLRQVAWETNRNFSGETSSNPVSTADIRCPRPFWTASRAKSTTSMTSGPLRAGFNLVFNLIKQQSSHVSLKRRGDEKANKMGNPYNGPAAMTWLNMFCLDGY